MPPLPLRSYRCRHVSCTPLRCQTHTRYGTGAFPFPVPTLHKWIRSYSCCRHNVFIPVDIVEDGVLGLALEPICETVGAGDEGVAGNEEMGGG